MRFTLKLSLELSIEQIKEEVMNEEKPFLNLVAADQKIIVVPGKIINIVT